MAEIGNLSVRLQIQSDIQEKLAEGQKQIDAFVEANKKNIEIVMNNVKLLDEAKQKIKDQVAAVKAKVNVSSVDFSLIKGKLDKEGFQTKVTPVLTGLTYEKGKKAGMPKITVPIGADPETLKNSIRAALKGFSVNIGVHVKGGKDLNGLAIPEAAQQSAGTYQSKLSGIETTLTRMRRLMLSLNTVWSTTTVLKNVIEIGGALQQQDVALQTLLGSERKQVILTKTLEQMAVKSPLSLSQTYAGVKQLAAYGIQYKDLADTIKSLGNIAAGTGVSLDRLTLAYGQVSARGILQGQELRQFTEAGVNLPQGLADYYSKLEGKMVSVVDVQDRISKRMVSFQDVKNVIDGMANGTGRFADQMEKQADTLLGVWSNLGDKVQLMYKGIVE